VVYGRDPPALILYTLGAAQVVAVDRQLQDRDIFGRSSGAADSGTSHYEAISGQVPARGAVCSQGLGVGSLEPTDGGRHDHSNIVQAGT
jgi:hypothetical protein